MDDEQVGLFVISQSLYDYNPAAVALTILCPLPLILYFLYWYLSVEIRRLYYTVCRISLMVKLIDRDREGYFGR